MANSFTPEKFARFVRWGVLAFIAYAVVHSLLSPSRTNTPRTAQNPTGQIKDCGGTGSPFETFTSIAAPLFASFAAPVHIEDTRPGTGESAQCGQHAKLRYMYATTNGNVIFNNKDEKEATEDVLIGGDTMLRGFEQGLIGMKPGGERTLIIPPNQGFGIVKDFHNLRDSEKFKLPKTLGSITAKAWLMALSPATPPIVAEARVIDNVYGNGAPALCGDTLHIDLAIYKLDGTKLFSTADSKPIAFTLGHSQLPYGIEQAVLGMNAGGRRTLILPPAYAQPLDPNGGLSLLPASLTLPPHELVLVEIGLREEGEESPSVKPAPAKTSAAHPKTPTSKKP